MKVTLVGSGGSAVSRKRACACILVDQDTLIDCGPGALRNLRTGGVDLQKIERLFVSHTHMDHVSDVVPLLWTMRLDERKSPFSVYGPEYTISNLLTLMRGMGTTDAFINFPLRFRPLASGDHLADVKLSETKHSVPTYAYRVERDGRKFAYSADTVYHEPVARFARDADLLVHEATFIDEQAEVAKLTLHSTGSDAGRAAREANVKQLVLFHIPPPNEHYERKIGEEAAKAFGGSATVGEDMLEFSL